MIFLLSLLAAGCSTTATYECTASDGTTSVTVCEAEMPDNESAVVGAVVDCMGLGGDAATCEALSWECVVSDASCTASITGGGGGGGGGGADTGSSSSSSSSSSSGSGSSSSSSSGG